MSVSLTLGLCLFGFLLATGQVLFKLAGGAVPVIRHWQDVVGLLGTAWFWLAIIVYGVATLLWVFLLQRVPLSRAYAFAALGFVLVPLAAWFLFGERITSRYVLGTALIIIGILVASTAGD